MRSQGINLWVALCGLADVAMRRPAGELRPGSSYLLAVATNVQRVPRGWLCGTAGALIAGALSGALNVTCGVNGPPVAVDAGAQPWTADQLVATVQAVFLPINVAAFLVLSAVPVRAGLCAASLAGTGASLLVGGCATACLPRRSGALCK